MNTTLLRGGAVAAAGALILGFLPNTVAQAAPVGSPISYDPCPATTTPLTIFGFNDFHGRILAADKLFTPVAAARTADGADNVALLSIGDNIGGSTFESASQDDNPTVQILNTIGIDASAVGNHEFDKGWADLQARQDGNSTAPNPVDFAAPLLAANVYTKGTTTVPAPLQPYTTFTRAGVTVAVIGAITADLPSLVSPDGIATLDVAPIVPAVNALTAQLRDGNTANGEADVVIAAIHEGAADGTTTAASNAASSAAFRAIYEQLVGVDVVFNGHTHQTYTWTTVDGAQLVQAASYGDRLARVSLQIDGATKKVCGTPASTILTPPAAAATPPISDITAIAAAAKAQSDIVGAEVIGQASAGISTTNGNADIRDRESLMSNAVAQMFYDTLSKGNTEFIGLQNPGGTRASLDAGPITFKEAALVLPFANSLMTTQVTGAQLKTALEQQWQRTLAGTVPSRAYLQLGVSKNLRYSYDESRPEGDRITAVYVNDKPIDPAKLYTVGSGSFLVAGGDNFHELGKGVNRVDTGQIDLQAMVAWVRANTPLAPDYAKHAVSVTGAPTGPIIAGQGYSVTLGQPLVGGVAKDTADIFLTALAPAAAVPNTSVTAHYRGTQVGSAAVTAGVAVVPFTLPAGATTGSGEIEFVLEPTMTKVSVPVTVDGPRASGRADIYALTPAGMYKHSGTNPALGDMTYTAGAKVHVTMLKQHNWLGTAKTDLFERLTNGDLTLRVDGTGAPMVIGQRWRGIDQVVPMGGANGEARFLIARRAVDGALFGYRFDGSRLIGLGQIGQNWGRMTTMVSVGDFSKDGRSDLVAIRTDGTLWVFNGTGDGRVGLGVQVGQGWSKFIGFTPGDIDGDGRVDLAGVRLDDGKLFGYANTGSGFAAASEIGSGFDTVAVRLMG